MAGSGDKWRWADSEGVQRVVQLDELRSALANGTLTPDTLVWRAGMEKWLRANQVPELGGAAPSLRGTIVGVPPPPASMVAVQSAFERGERTSPPVSNPAPSSASNPPSSARPAPSTGEAKKKSVPPTGAWGAAPKKKSVSPADAETKPSVEAKKKSVPPASSPAASSAAAGSPKKKSGPPPPPAHAPTPSSTAAKGVASAPGAAKRAEALAALPDGSDVDFDTWIAHPAVTELAPTAAPPPVAPVHTSPASPTPASPVAARGAPYAVPPGAQHAMPPAATPVLSRPPLPPVTALPPTRLSSPLPPPPRRSHPVPPTPSSAPQAFAQSSISYAPPFGSGDALSPPSVPALHPPPTMDAGAANLGADGDLPSFPLDEIDPDDERPFRPSQGPTLVSPSGHPALAVDASQHGSTPPGHAGSSGQGFLRSALAYVRANPRDPKLLVGLSGGAVLVVGLLWGFAATSGSSAKRTGTTSDEEHVKAATSAEAAGSARPLASAIAAANSVPKEPVTACRLTGTSGRLAEKVSKDVPLELATVASGEKIRLGFATAANVAEGISIDPGSLQVTTEFTKTPRDKLRAVVPFAEGTSEFVVHHDGRADRLKAWRQIANDPPLIVGWSGSAIAYSSRPNHAPTQLWALEGDDAPDAIRAVDAGDRGHAIVFRRKGEIWGGVMGPDHAVAGDLVKIAGAGAPPGSPIGAPVAAVSGQTLAVVFADRASSAEPWSLRIGSAPVGSFPRETTAFAVPPGGPGGATLAPALAGLPGGRWLLVWTEGSGGAHDVRGVTLGPDLAPVGAPFNVSRPGSNAGQAAVTLRAGAGLVVYLALTEEGYEAWGTGVDCR